MGAQNIDFEIKGKATIKQIKERFLAEKDEDFGPDPYDDEEEFEPGYTGGFSTIDRVDTNFLDSGTGDYEKDYEFALSKSQKRDTCVAIFTKSRNGDDITLVVGWGSF